MEQSIDHQQQLDLISEMIASARQEFTDKSFLFLLWGWAVAIASISEFVLIKMGKSYNAIVWLIFIPAALILQVIFLLRLKKKERVRTHLDNVMGQLWIAIGVSLGAVLFAQQQMQLNTYPVLILLYGIGTYVSGSIMKLKVMKFGAIGCWVIGFAAFYASFDYQLLLLSLSLLISYIIPGHILQNRFRKNV